MQVCLEAVQEVCRCQVLQLIDHSFHPKNKNDYLWHQPKLEVDLSLLDILSCPSLPKMGDPIAPSCNPHHNSCHL